MTQLTIMQYLYICIAIISVGIGIVVYIKLRRTLGYKHFKYKLKRIDYADTVILLEGGGYAFDALPITSHGKNLFLEDKNDKYGYAPIANGLAVIEENNAIPVVRGGWIPTKIEPTARNKADVKAEGELDEVETGKLFRWVINAGKLKSTLIRPLQRWSSRELDSAIKSKIIQELLDIPLKFIDVIIIIGVIGSIGATIYFGYQNSNLLQQILSELIIDPYVPVP